MLHLIPGNTELAIAVEDDVAKYHQGGTKYFKPRMLKLSFGDVMLIVREIDLVLMKGYWSGV